MALCTGLGALPFALVGNINRQWLGFGNAMAAGLMLGASLGLGMEAARESWIGLAVGLGLGVMLMLLVGAFVPEPNLEKQVSATESLQANFRRMLLIMVAMTAHSFAEGIGVGVSFAGREGFGELISAAIAVHNIPEGLAIALVMVPRGVSVIRAVGWGVFSSLPQPLMAVPAFLFVNWFRPFLPVGLGLAAGAMIYMVWVELLPEARENIGTRNLVLVLIPAMVAMVVFQLTLL